MPNKANARDPGHRRIQQLGTSHPRLARARDLRAFGVNMNDDTSRLADPKPFFAITVGSCVLMTGVGLFIAPQFGELFEAFGQQLPLPTRIAARPWCGPLLAALFLTLALAFQGQHKRGFRNARAFLALTAVVSIAALIGLIWSLYLPLARMSHNIL